jgi:hypothetical protein
VERKSGIGLDPALKNDNDKPNPDLGLKLHIMGYHGISWAVKQIARLPLEKVLAELGIVLLKTLFYICK